MKRSKKVVIVYVLCGLVWLLAVSLYVICDWSKARFGVGLNELFYTLASPLKGADTDVVCDAIKDCVPEILKKCILFLVFLLFDISVRVSVIVHIKVIKKYRNINIMYLYRIVLCGMSAFMMYHAIMHIDMSYELFKYIEMKKTATTIYEDYYVDPHSVDITLEGEQKNLIFIYMESMETTYASVKEGGYQEENYIPYLTQLAKDEISFSDEESLGGAKPLAGSTWTMGALFAHSSGIPFSFPVDGNSMGEREKFASGVTTLGDILQEEGYNQVFMCGSDASFAGRREFYEQHGDYKIFDYHTAIEERYIEEGYYVWWGYEDEILYDIAKEEISELAASNEPFNFTMLTVDTHFPDGYVCELCEYNSDNIAANVIMCADKQVYEFIEWCKKQEWYDDTIVVIVGDHKRMDETLVTGIETSERETYNCFINVNRDDVQCNNRVFTSVDLFPTTLAAMGYEIEGDRLGLGTNLLSDKKTLSEELGWQQFNDEVSKYSNYYIKNFN